MPYGVVIDNNYLSGVDMLPEMNVYLGDILLNPIIYSWEETMMQLSVWS